MADLFVALAPGRDLLLCAKHLFVAAMVAGCGVILGQRGRDHVGRGEELEAAAT